MSFTDQEPFEVTAEHKKLHWGGCPSGKLCCNLCGHIFKVGEKVRWQFANRKTTNFFVCEGCDNEDRDALIETFMGMKKEFERLSRVLGKGSHA